MYPKLENNQYKTYVFLKTVKVLKKMKNNLQDKTKIAFRTNNSLLKSINQKANRIF